MKEPKQVPGIDELSEQQLITILFERSERSNTNLSDSDRNRLLKAYWNYEGRMIDTLIEKTG